MILCRCSCGELFRLDDNLAGGVGECQGCGKDLVIPKDSDPDVMLVFKAGADDEGVLMLRSEMERKLAAGELEPTDLYWKTNSWQPLGQLFGDTATPVSVEANDKPRLKLRRSGEGDAETADEQIVLPCIPQPDQGQDKAKSAAAKKQASKGPGLLTKLLSRIRRKKKVSPAPAQPAGKNWRHAKSTQIIIVLLILGIGYKYGFGPLLAHYRKQPSMVIVRNGENINYNATLGWSREKMDLMANSFCRFERFTGMPEWPTLKLTPADGKGKIVKLAVPVRMGGKILVNVENKTQFQVVDTGSLVNQKIDDGVQQLIADLSANKAPESSVTIANRIHDLAKSACKGIVTDTFFDLTAKYRMDNYFGINDMSEMKQQEARPILTVQPSLRTHFSNGSVNIAFAKPDAVEGTVRLPGFTVALPPDIKIAMSNDSTVTIVRDDHGVLRVSMGSQGQILKVQKGSFPGNWSYQATKAPNKEWDWHWNFMGEGLIDKDRVTVTCAWIKNQNPSVNIEKHVTVKVE